MQDHQARIGEIDPSLAVQTLSIRGEIARALASPDIGPDSGLHVQPGDVTGHMLDALPDEVRKLSA